MGGGLRRGMPGPDNAVSIYEILGLKDPNAVTPQVGLEDEPSVLATSVLQGQQEAMNRPATVPRRTPGAAPQRTPLAQLTNRPRTMVPGGRPKGL